MFKLFIVFLLYFRSDQKYKGKKSKIHYSGLLIKPDGNLDVVLREHERNIQEAVRQTRLDKSREL